MHENSIADRLPLGSAMKNSTRVPRAVTLSIFMNESDVAPRAAFGESAAHVTKRIVAVVVVVVVGVYRFSLCSRSARDELALTDSRVGIVHWEFSHFNCDSRGA